MAYTAKTWAVNEVITSTALNNLETGAEEAYLMSEAVIDADKDWNDKKITNLNTVETTTLQADTYTGLKVSASDDLRYTGAGVTTTSSTYAKVAEKTVATKFGSSTMRIGITYRVQNAGPTVSVRVYRDGVAVGAEHSTTSTTGVTVSDDIALTAGNLLQIYAKSSDGATACIISSWTISYASPWSWE